MSLDTNPIDHYKKIHDYLKLAKEKDKFIKQHIYEFLKAAKYKNSKVRDMDPYDYFIPTYEIRADGKISRLITYENSDGNKLLLFYGKTDHISGVNNYMIGKIVDNNRLDIIIRTPGYTRLEQYELSKILGKTKAIILKQNEIFPKGWNSQLSDSNIQVDWDTCLDNVLEAYKEFEDLARQIPEIEEAEKLNVGTCSK